MRTCSKCQEPKDVLSFYPKMGRCKECHNKAASIWQQENKLKAKLSRDKWRAKPGSKEIELLASLKWQANNPEQTKRNRLRAQVKLYGLTLEEYENMLQQQKGCCAICGDIPKRRLDIDHNHKTGKVRALLCHPCNTAIGSLKEDLSLFSAAISYLNSHL